MVEYKLWERLFTELCDLECVVRILSFGSKRQSIIKCVSVSGSKRYSDLLFTNFSDKFQQLMQHYNICERFCQLFKDYDNSFDNSLDEVAKVVQYGMLIGGFLSECGWLSYANEVLSKVFYNGEYFFCCNTLTR